MNRKCYFAVVEPIYLHLDDLSFHCGLAANVSITFRALATSTLRSTARVQTELEHMKVIKQCKKSESYLYRFGINET